VTSNTLWRYR